jgi:transducin (beta)-like 1
MALSSDELNYLIYRYLQESGFSHSAFAFACESLVAKASVSGGDIPPGALISFVQKGLQYLEIEASVQGGASADSSAAPSLSLLHWHASKVAENAEEKRRRLLPWRGIPAMCTWALGIQSVTKF